MDDCKLYKENGCRKIISKVKVSYTSGALLCSGIVTNVSTKCMCVYTNLRFPSDCTIKLLRPSYNAINIRVRVDKYQYINRSYKLSLEVVNPPLEYINLVNKNQ